MKRKAKAVAIAGVLTLALTTYAHETQPAVVTAKPAETPTYISQAAVLSALTETPQLVGLTGEASKTVAYTDSKWYGDKTYELTVHGEFKLGIDTQALEVTTKGNTITIRFPQPKLISADLPFDQAVLSKDVGVLRKDLTEGQLQSLYGQARIEAIAEIQANEDAKEKAADAVEQAIEDIIEAVAPDAKVNVEEAE